MDVTKNILKRKLKNGALGLIPSWPPSYHQVDAHKDQEQGIFFKYKKSKKMIQRKVHRIIQFKDLYLDCCWRHVRC